VGIFLPSERQRAQILGQLINGQKKTVMEIGEDLAMSWQQRAKTLSYLQSLETKQILDSERVEGGNGVRKYFIRDAKRFSELLDRLLQ
jgi:predicted polyphosphate/ATP-dependent NAD kinase